MTAPSGTAVTAPAEDEKLKTWLTKAEPEIAKILPKHITAERMVKAALVCAVRNPDVAKCSRDSILLAVMRAAHLGLEIGEDIHLVPINKKVKRNGKDEWVKTCEAWPDYRGLMKLAMQGGLVRHMVPYVVRQGDRFEYELGLNERLSHHPNSKSTAPVTHAYAIITLRYGAKTFHVMSIEEIEARRAKSKSWGPDAYPVCPDWYAKKCVLRDWLNRQPKTAKLSEALEVDDQVEGLRLPAGVTSDGEVVDAEIEESSDAHD